MIYKPVQQPTEAASAVDLGLGREVVQLEMHGRQYPVDKRRVVLGRSRECDIQVEDPNVSRRHAEIRQEGATYWMVDLDSTNGIEVGGKRQKCVKLENGTKLMLGSTEVIFRREVQS